MKPYILLLYLFLVACSSIPTNIENPPVFDLSYSYANQDSERFKKLPVRWGGVIAEVENEQTASYLQILAYPLNSYGRPRLDEQAQGRFVVKSKQFLDPLLYEKNSEITVAGTFLGKIDRTIDKKTMSLPLVEATTLYQWPVYQPYYPYPYYYGGYGYGGWAGFGYYSPYYYYGFPRYGWGWYPYW